MTMVRRNRLRSARPKAVFGADGAIMAAATLAAAGIQSAATARSAREQATAMTQSAKQQADALKLQNENANKNQEQMIEFTREQNDLNRDLQKQIQMNLQLLTGRQNENELRENAKIQVKRGGSMRRKLRNTPTTFLRGRNGNLPFTVTDGGDVLPLGTTLEGYDLYEIIGNDHEHYHKAQGGKNKTGVGIKFANSGVIEGEGNQNSNQGELMLVTPDDAKFISKHTLRGFNPAQAVMAGEDPMLVFNQQEAIKDAYGISDDGKSGSSTPVRRIRPYGGMTTLNVSPDLSLDFMAPVATGIVAGTRDEYFAGGDPTLKKRYPKEGPEAIYAIAKWREKHAIDGRPYPTTFIDRLNAYYDDKEYNHPMNNKKKDTNTVPKELKNISDYYNFVEKYGNTRPYPRTLNEKINEAIIERQEKNQLKTLQRQKDIESSSIYRKINQIDNDYLNNMFIHPSYEKTMRNPQGDTYGRRSLKKCGGRRKAPLGTWYSGLNDTQKGNLWGAGFQAVGNLGGALISNIGNNIASRYLTRGYDDAANILVDAYGNLKTIDMSAIDRNDYRSAHAMAALQAPIVQTGAERSAAERSLQRNLARINRGTLSSAAAQNRSARAESDYNDRINQIESNADKIRQGIIQENMRRITETSAKNAELDAQANRDYTQAYLNLLQYNNDIVNEGITGAAQAKADATLNRASTIASTKQANAAGWAGAFNSSLGGFANTLATNGKLNHEYAMAKLGATDDSIIRSIYADPNSSEARQDAYSIWLRYKDSNDSRYKNIADDFAARYGFN